MAGDPDVIVVGAGPAGSTVATLLVARGADVLLLDRADFPRPKPCGQSLNPGAVRELDELGLLGSVRQLPHRETMRWRIQAPGGGVFEGGYPAGVHGIAVDRAALDMLLLDRARSAGVRVQTGLRVDDLIRRSERVSGVRMANGRAISARFVIGADGIRSVVARRLGLHRQGRRRKLGLTAHVRGARLTKGTGTLIVRSWGCVGAVDVGPDLTNVVVVLSRPGEWRLQGNPARCFDRVIADLPGLADARRCSPILATGPFDAPLRKVVAPGALLIGDAAGYFDPFTGQGVCKALRSARQAAEVIGGSPGFDPDDEALSGYDGWYGTAFTPGRHLQKVIDFGASHPSAFDAAVALLRSAPAVADRLLSVTGDLLPVRALGWPKRSQQALALRHHPADRP